MSNGRHRLRTAIRRMALWPFAQDVLIAQLLNGTKPVQVAEGYGGKPIEMFPPYRFFQLHEEQRADEAREQFRGWYREQFRKYSSVEKDAGGMRKGSLYRLVVDLHVHQGLSLSGDQPAFREELVESAIAQRVDQRFQLLTSIKESGYDLDLARLDAVIGMPGPGNTIVLTGGHHRCAALKAIGRAALPEVFVLSPMTRSVLRTLRIA